LGSFVLWNLLEKFAARNHVDARGATVGGVLNVKGTIKVNSKKVSWFHWWTVYLYKAVYAGSWGGDAPTLPFVGNSVTAISSC
jgi:hypothetical protein